MKKLLVIITCIIIVFASNALDINDIPRGVEYCEVVGYWMGMGTDVKFTINFGKDYVAKNYISKNGEKYQFKSMIDIVNFMHDNGWELYSTYVLVGMPTMYYYVMKKVK